MSKRIPYLSTVACTCSYKVKEYISKIVSFHVGHVVGARAVAQWGTTVLQPCATHSASQRGSQRETLRGHLGLTMTQQLPPSASCSCIKQMPYPWQQLGSHPVRRQSQVLRSTPYQLLQHSSPQQPSRPKSSSIQSPRCSHPHLLQSLYHLTHPTCGPGSAGPVPELCCTHDQGSAEPPQPRRAGPAAGRAKPLQLPLCQQTDVLMDSGHFGDHPVISST